MKKLSWEEARDITESYFLPFKCVVDETRSDYKNVVPFVVYYDFENSEERYGPFALTKFKDPERLEFMLSTYKAQFELTMKKRQIRIRRPHKSAL